jgi:hypothetical protein
MPPTENISELIEDVITGEKIPLIGAEENRQNVARILITQKGYAKKDIRRAVPIEVVLGSESYRSKVDLVVTVNGKSVMLIKCAAGSLGSRERETLAAARLLESHPIPLSIVSDGHTAVVLDTTSGKMIGKGWEIVPTRQEATKRLAAVVLPELPPGRREKEGLIFRSYDSMNVNVF